MPHSVLDSLIVSLEIAYRELVVLDLTEELSSVQTEIVRSCLFTLRSIEESTQVSERPQTVFARTDVCIWGAASDGLLVNPQKPHPSFQVVAFSAHLCRDCTSCEQTNTWRGLVYLHYVGFVFRKLCLVGNCVEPLGKVSFHLKQLQFIGTSRCGF